MLLEVGLAGVEIGRHGLDGLPHFGRRLVGLRDHLLLRLELLHQFDLLIVELADDFLGHLDLVGQRFELLVLLRLELLHGILLDELLLRLDVQLELLAVGFNLLGAMLGIVERGVGGGELGLQAVPLGADARQLFLDVEKLAIAILEDEKFFDDRKHGFGKLNFARRLSAPQRQVNRRQLLFLHILTGCVSKRCA